MFKNKKLESRFYLKNKKSQIGTTLTWFAAFLIIFFVIALFITATFILSARKNVPLFGWKEKIKMVGGEVEALESQRALDIFLNFQTKENKNMKELIIWSVNEYGDSDEDFSELNIAIEEFFQDLNVIWRVDLIFKGGNYFNENGEKGDCSSEDLSFSRMLFNEVGKTPEKFLVSLRFCEGVKEVEDEENE